VDTLTSGFDELLQIRYIRQKAISAFSDREKQHSDDENFQTAIP
jgi:hypothetical protein